MGGYVTGVCQSLTPGVKSKVPFQFGTRYGPIRTRGARGHGVMPGAGTFLRYGPIRTRGARGHGVMPGAGTFLHRVDQSERRTVEAWRDAGRWNFSAGI